MMHGAFPKTKCLRVKWTGLTVPFLNHPGSITFFALQNGSEIYPFLAEFKDWWVAEQRGVGSSAVPVPLSTQLELQFPLPP
jgi:hypothetical protein